MKPDHHFTSCETKKGDDCYPNDIFEFNIGH